MSALGPLPIAADERLFPEMTELLGPQQLGEARIGRVVVSEREAAMANLRARFSGTTTYEDDVRPGTYATLHVDGELMMSDTRMERLTNARFVKNAEGRVLVAGLGLGLILHALAQREPSVDTGPVEDITVIEKSADVIKLVAPTLPRGGAPITCVCADIFTWSPPKGAKYDTIYFDIWPTISGENVLEMARLHRRFAPRLNRTNPNAWLSSWRVEWCRYLRRMNR